MKRIEQAEIAIEKIALAEQILTFLLEDMSRRIGEIETEIALISDDNPERIEVIEKDVAFLKELTSQFAGNYHPLATKFREDTENRIKTLENELDIEEGIMHRRVDYAHKRITSLVEALCLKEFSSNGETTFQKETTSNGKTTSKIKPLSENSMHPHADIMAAVIVLEKENMELRDRLNRLEERFDNHLIVEDARFVGIESNIS